MATQSILVTASEAWPACFWHPLAPHVNLSRLFCLCWVLKGNTRVMCQVIDSWCLQLAATLSWRCNAVPGRLPADIFLLSGGAAYAGFQFAAHLLHGARLQRMGTPAEREMDCCAMRASSSGFAGGHLSASGVDNVRCKNISKHVQGLVYAVFYIQPLILRLVGIGNGQMQVALLQLLSTAL